MKKITIITLFILSSVSLLAKPVRHKAPVRHHRHGPVHVHHRNPPRYHHYKHRHSTFWPGFVGGIVGGIVTDAIVSRPVVTTTPIVAITPVVTTRQVWVDGHYTNKVMPNGTVVRVWQPGYYKTVTITN